MKLLINYQNDFYVKNNNFGTIDAVAEKNVISNEATCGIYFWNKGSDYVKYANQMIQIRQFGLLLYCGVLAATTSNT
mgnify:CR=1 FL=1